MGVEITAANKMSKKWLGLSENLKFSFLKLRLVSRDSDALRTSATAYAHNVCVLNIIQLWG